MLFYVYLDIEFLFVKTCYSSHRSVCLVNLIICYDMNLLTVLHMNLLTVLLVVSCFISCLSMYIWGFQAIDLSHL